MQNKISVNPIQLFGYNRLNLEYERTFNEGKYGIAFYFGSTGHATRKIHGQYSYLSEQNASFRYYRKSFNTSSLYFNGTLTVSSGKIEDENVTDKAYNVGALGILGGLGYQIIHKSFYFNPYINTGVSLTNNLFGTAEYYGNFSKPGNLLLTYGFKMGIVF